MDSTKGKSNTQATAVPRAHCQNGRNDVCLAASLDSPSVICPNDSCDIDDGLRCVSLGKATDLNAITFHKKGDRVAWSSKGKFLTGTVFHAGPVRWADGFNNE